MKEQSPPLEIERKFLIVRPEPALLRAQPGVRVYEIEQIYLRCDIPGSSARVRCRRESSADGQTALQYFHTVKHRLAAGICEEDERQISESDFLVLREQADPERHPIRKTRFAFPHAGHRIEVDRYPAWRYSAIAEVELQSADEPMALPPVLTVRREVTDDRRYSNRSMAREMPPEL